MSEEKYIEMIEDGTLYNYITNLQEENERLKDNFDFNLGAIENIREENERLKQRLYELTTKIN